MNVLEEFDYEAVQDAQTIKDFLKALLDGVEKGKIVLSVDGSEIVLHPADLMMFAIKARKKTDACRLNIKLSWKESRLFDSFGSGEIEIIT
jgi:amphi-Trp domain-containing protein